MRLINRIRKKPGVFALFVATSALVGIAIYRIAMVAKQDAMVAKQERQRVVSARELEGKVVKEDFYPAVSGGCDSRPDKYIMMVKLPDGSSRIFSYSGNEAREKNTEYDVGSVAKFKDGFKPGDDY